MTFNGFMTDESGAVAVDWVVLTAGLVGLGIATLAVVSGGIENLSGDIGQELANIDVGALPFGAAAAAVVAVQDFAGYSLVGPQHSEAWRNSEQDRFAAMDDAQLLADFETSFAIAQGGQYPHAQHETDRMGVMLGEMSRRGMEISEVAQSYETLHSSMGGVSG